VTVWVLVQDHHMSPAPSDVDLLLATIDKQLPAEWPQRGGWPNEIEAALLDAVLSIRSRYGKKPTTGVRGAVGRYREHRGTQLDDLTALAAMKPVELQTVLRNRQKTGRVTKAEAIVNAAGALSAIGVVHAADLDPTSELHLSTYCSVRGLGPVTWRYFTLLLGTPGVKADTWIIRFVAAALSRRVSSAQAEELVGAAADTLGVSRTVLDHAIWRSMSA
jgi:hypothetical protein